MPLPDAAPTVDGMPVLGLGTWQNDDPTVCSESVRTALEMGYRHIDTAQIYDNERAVGGGIETADVPRENIFLATKVWISNLNPADVISSTEASLEKLGTDYVDLLYVHWPAGEYNPDETLPAFGELLDRGLIQNIGVSNFEPHHIDRAREVLNEPIFANQVEIHPFLQQEELRAYAAETDLNIVAYSPLARTDVLSDPVIESIAENHDVSEPQVSLAWLRQKGLTAIPKATGKAHINDNWQSLDVELTDEDIARIDDIDRRSRKVHPDFAPDAWDE